MGRFGFLTLEQQGLDGLSLHMHLLMDTNSPKTVYVYHIIDNQRNAISTPQSH